MLFRFDIEKDDYVEVDPVDNTDLEYEKRCKEEAEKYYSDISKEEVETREIEFRGKTLQDEWIYGYIFKSQSGGYYIVDTNNDGDDGIDVRLRLVVKETVGQYTGLKDKNGKKIWEGDITFFGQRTCVVCLELGSFGLGSSKEFDYEQIEITADIKTSNCYSGCYNDNFISLWEIYWNYNCEESYLDEIEVIGNIHDNPELLEE